MSALAARAPYPNATLSSAISRAMASGAMRSMGDRAMWPVKWQGARQLQYRQPAVVLAQGGQDQPELTKGDRVVLPGLGPRATASASADRASAIRPSTSSASARVAAW